MMTRAEEEKWRLGLGEAMDLYPDLRRAFSEMTMECASHLLAWLAGDFLVAHIPEDKWVEIAECLRKETLACTGLSR